MVVIHYGYDDLRMLVPQALSEKCRHEVGTSSLSSTENKRESTSRVDHCLHQRERQRPQRQDRTMTSWESPSSPQRRSSGEKFEFSAAATGASAASAQRDSKNLDNPQQSSQLTNTNKNPAPSVLVGMIGSSSSSGCQPYSKRAEIHSPQEECAAAEIAIESETRVLISRPEAHHDCEMCAQTVKAHEASHYLALELNTVVLPLADDIDVFTKCHTCLCGVLAIYDGPYLLGEWCYGRFTSKYLTSTSRSLSFVYKPDMDSSNPNASFSLTVKPVTVSHTEIIEVDRLDEGIKSGSITSAGFPRRSYDKFADGYQLWIFVNKRPNTTMRLQVNDIFIKPPEMVGFCQDPINIFHGPPQVSNTWHRMLCDRSYPEDFYFHSPIVSVVFSPNNYGSISEFANGFNMSYTFFDRNVTGHKNLDCGEFNNSARAYGQGFTLPPGMNKPFGVAGSASGAAASATSEIGSSKGSGGADAGSSSPSGGKDVFGSGSGQVVHSSNLNDLRCHWRLSGDSLAQGYSRYLVTVSNFTVKPVSSNDETMKQLEAESKPVQGSDKWSIVLKESAGLKLFDGIYSTSHVLTAHSAVDSSQPGNKAAFYLSSGSAIRIDVSYPTTTLGTIGFAYAAIYPASEDSEHPCDVFTEFLCDAVSSDRPKVAGAEGEELKRYCIRKELVCDGFVNCVEGDDEDPSGRSQCANRTFILPRGGSKNPQGLDKEERLDRGMEFGQRVSTPVIISLVFAVVVVLLGTVTIILITKRRGSNNRNSRRRSSQRGLSHRNPALDDTSSAPGGRSSTGGPEGVSGGFDQQTAGATGGSRSGRSSRHNSGESGSRNDSSWSGPSGTGIAPGPYATLLSPQQPQIMEHDPHVTPQPLFIAKMPSQQPPLYDLVVSRRLPSVDEEAELSGANNSLSEDDRTFLLQTSNTKNSDNNNHSII